MIGLIFWEPKYLKEREENREGEKRRETKILDEKLNNHGGLKGIEEREGRTTMEA